MRTLAVLCSIIVLGCSTAATHDGGEPVADGGTPDLALAPSPDEQQAFDALLKDATTALARSNTPGASIAVVLRGRLTFAGAVGVKRVYGTDPVTPQTRFRVGSMSKMLVAIAAMQLVEEGKLDLGKPITTYLPWFKLASGFDAGALTTAQLLSHTSGFPSDTLLFCYDADSMGPRQAWFASHPQPLWSPPGAVWDYSNFGYALAGLVVTSAAGVGDDGFEAMIGERVFKRAGMTTATFDPKSVEDGDYASGTSVSPDGTVYGAIDPLDLDCPLLRPFGGAMATASDYAHLLEAFLANGGGLVRPDSLAALEAPRIELRTFAGAAYGYGLFSQRIPYPSHTLLWHGGAVAGYQAEMYVIPDLGFGVVVMANSLGGEEVSDSIANLALHRFVAETPVAPSLATPSSTWTGYPGTYSDPYGLLGALTVTLAADDGGVSSLQVNAPSARDVTGKAAPFKGAMTQAGNDTWQLPTGEAVTFWSNDAGVVDRVVSRSGVAARAP
jgi:CubicO group peptidase (beta-lactamase class C family)